MKQRSLHQLIAVKEAELFALEALLSEPQHVLGTLTQMRPDLWVQCLAELSLLRDYAAGLSESFEMLVRDASVPLHRRRLQKLRKH